MLGATRLPEAAAVVEALVRDGALGDSAALADAVATVKAATDAGATVDDRTFSNLEWNAPLHEMTDAVLWIRSHGLTTTTTVYLTLFEPFE